MRTMNRVNRGIVYVSLTLCFLVSRGWSAEESTHVIHALEDANDKKVKAAYDSKDYAELEKVCKEILKQTPDDSRRRYDLACAQARLGKKAEAFASLNTCRESHYFDVQSSFKHMQEDSDLAGLHDDKQWTELTNKIKPVAERNEKLYSLRMAIEKSLDNQKFKDAIELTDGFLRLVPPGPDSSDVLLNRAEALAMLGQKADAFSYLEQYLAASKDYVEDLENDAYLAGLKREGKFKALVEKARQKTSQLAPARNTK